MYKGIEEPTPPTDHTTWPPYRNSMCPSGRALEHPAAPTLTEWAQFGCPTKTGQPWTKEEIWVVVNRGPHQSALSKEAIKHFAIEAAKKVHTKQARIVDWDSIKDNPPKELKISPIAAIPHKSKAYRSILDLLFRLQLKNGGIWAAVNDTTEKTALKGAINQIGEALSRIVQVFAEADENAKIFMEKWDIKDGFLAHGLHGGRRMELCIRAALRGRQTYKTGGPHFAADGMGWIPTIFLCSHRNV
jgi:hypothetical protein